MPAADLVIDVDDPRRPDVVDLLSEHLSELRAQSPPESVHALDPDALARTGVTFWTMRAEGRLLGCGALMHLSEAEAEIKSMRTARAARGLGVGARMLARLLEECRRGGYARVSLETGPQEFFAPARRLYTRHGFTECGPFGSYRPDPYSVFMTRLVEPAD